MLQRENGGESEEGKDGGRANWSRESLFVLCDLCLEHVDISKGKSGSKTCQRISWKTLEVAFKTKTNLPYDKVQLKHKYDWMRNRWSLWKQLKGSETGLGWDHEKKTIGASKEWWLKKIKENNNFRVFKDEGIEPELEDKMDQLFGVLVATGGRKYTPAMAKGGRKYTPVMATATGSRKYTPVMDPPSHLENVQHEVDDTYSPSPPYYETFREATPIHFLFKIESFSLLSKNSIVKYESNEFETGGYKWKLSLYPDGNKNENGKGHISMYLVLVDSFNVSTSLPDCWELNVLFRLFLFDQIRGRYFIRGDMEGGTKRFNEMKRVWGFPQFVSLVKFTDPANGYLVDDTCVFGAEIFIAKPPGNIECLSMVKEATTVIHTWKIENFSNIKVECLYSDKFKAGCHNWELEIYPKGHSVGKNNSISLYLHLSDSEEYPGRKVYADFKLSIRDQSNLQHIGFSTVHWFDASSLRWGWHKFVGLSKMNDKGNGYLVKDTCIVEAEVKVLGVVSKRQKLT